jgi:O-antigen/teichoic acid export membrane protein
MINPQVILYFGSRGLSAAGNLLAVAVFTRLASPAEYGQYLLIFAWSLIAFGFSTQWMRFAYFGVHQASAAEEYAASLAKLVGAALALTAAGFVAVGLLGAAEPKLLAAVYALIVGMSLYEASFEVARTRLHAGRVSASMMLRMLLSISLGSLALWGGGGPTGLALAVALAHACAAIPCVLGLLPLDLSRATRAASWQLVQYGWPLLASFGVMAVGQSIDRLILAHLFGAETLGSYGVVADLLRQSFAVVGEAIMLAWVTLAKQQANAGKAEQSDRTLRAAFRACLATALFGTAFFVIFGDVVLRVFLGPQFVGLGPDVVAILALAFACMVMRNFYFAQVIYFTRASYLELAVSLLFVVISSVLSVWLIPGQGARGGALALLAGYAVSCVAFVLLGRRHYRMPVDLPALGGLALLAALFMASAELIGLFAPRNGAWLLLQAGIFVLLGRRRAAEPGSGAAGMAAAVGRPALMRRPESGAGGG